MRARTAAAAVALGAGVLALRRRRAAGPARPDPRPVAPPPSGRPRTVLTEDGVPLAVTEHGPPDAAATVVLAHGYVQSARLWAGQVQDLLATHPELRIVTYDHRGHGRSGRTPRERATIEQLGRDLSRVLTEVAPSGPLVLAGHSMGGMALMALAEQHPEVVRDRVAGVAFVATSSAGLGTLTYGLPGPVAAALRRVLPLLTEKALRDELRGRPRRLAPGTTRTLFGLDPHPEDVRETLEDMLACTAETVAFFSATFSGHDRTAALAGLAEVPAVVLVGDRDLLCPLEHSRAIAGALPRAELVVYPGAGHMVQLERREEVSRQLGALVDRALDQARVPS